MKDLIRSDVKGSPPKNITSPASSKKMNIILQWILAIPAFIIVPISVLGGIAIHLWTVVIALNTYGWIAAAISFFTPILSALFFVYDTWRHIGFWNTFNLAIIIYISLILINMVLVTIIQKLEQNR